MPSFLYEQKAFSRLPLLPHKTKPKWPAKEIKLKGNSQQPRTSILWLLYGNLSIQLSTSPRKDKSTTIVYTTAAGSFHIQSIPYVCTCMLLCWSKEYIKPRPEWFSFYCQGEKKWSLSSHMCMSWISWCTRRYIYIYAEKWRYNVVTVTLGIIILYKHHTLW